MEYTITLGLNAPHDAVCRLYGDHVQMIQWETGLTRVESIPGSDKSVYLVFEQNHAVHRMKETILEWNELDRHDAVYEMGPVWNRCLSIFSKDGNQTKWTMHVEFRNVDQLQLPPSAFEQKTLTGMMAFKNHIESLYAQ